ncbi:MAG: RidA family protein [Chloroflexota bacterium]
MQILQPPGWARPRGYSNGIAAEGKLVFVAGQIGWNAEQQFETHDFAEQTRQALENICAVLAEAGGRPEHITRMVWYVVDKHEYMNAYPQIGEVYREIIGKHFPSMTAIEVSALIEDEARVEIEVTAVIPNE